MIRKRWRESLALLVFASTTGGSGAAELGQRDWTVADSVQRRFIQTSWRHPYNHASRESVARFSPDGAHFFIVAFRGDLAADENVFDLLVYASDDVSRSLRAGDRLEREIKPFRTVQMRSGGRFLHDFAAIYLPEWQGNHAITFVGTHGRQTRSVYRYDVRTGKLERLSEPEHWVAESGGGEYAVRGSTTMFRTYKVENAPSPTYPFQVISPRLLHNLSGREGRVALDATHWQFHASYKGGPSKLVASGEIGYSRGAYVGGPWISPDERWAVMLYRPEGWDSPAHWSAYSFRTRTLWYMLIDLQSGVSRPLADRPTGPGFISTGGDYEIGRAFWSSDSRHVLIANLAHPLDVSDDVDRSRASYFIDIEIATGRTNVVDRFANDSGLRASAQWIEEGKSLFVASVAGDRRSTRLYRYDRQRWEAAAAARMPVEKKTSPFQVEIEQSVSAPPALIASTSSRRLVLLAAESYPDVRRTPVEAVEWTDSSGRHAKGILLLPKGFTKGDRVPVVIQFMNSPLSTFAPDGMPGTCDVAQSLAAHGFVVLQLVAAGGYGSENVDATLLNTPAELPAQVARVDSAIEMLATRGVPSDVPVGLTGFSRTGLYVYYVTTHPARTRIGAGIVCDSITNSFGEYIQLAGTAGADETQHLSLQFGNGKSFWENKQGWLDAPEFNLDRLRSPLLFHTHGNPVLWGTTETVGAFLLARRPFEFHYYPEAGHALTSPRQQAAAMQSTIDWMRFWLQGKEREVPEDPERYVRWRKIKAAWENVLKEEAASPTQGTSE